MKKHCCIVIFLIFTLCCGVLFAQDSTTSIGDDFFEGDINDLFGGNSEDATEDPFLNTNDPPSSNDEISDAPPLDLATSLRKIGFTLDAGFNFAGGYAPGWKTAPWYWDDSDKGFSHLLLATMQSTISFDIQLSEILRVKQSMALAIPELEFEIPEFFFDFNLLNRVFFRAGKYVLNWGISPNFPYTNLPSRIPNDVDSPGDLYIARADIPIGVGGFQLVGMARGGILGITNDDLNDEEQDLSIEDFTFGLKYNIAVPIVDVDIGVLYNQALDTKGFVSLKTTLFDQLELYSEGLVSYNFDEFDHLAGSGSIGFIQDLFDRKLTVNAELYYNGEQNATYAQEKTFFNSDETGSFLYGFNTALNLRYKPSWLKKTELFLNYLHGFRDNTAQVVPGFRITPLSNLSLYMAVPMALGGQDGFYYTNNIDENNRPFSIVMLISFSGNYQYSNYK